MQLALERGIKILDGGWPTNHTKKGRVHMFAAHLNTTTPVSFTALQKATGLSATKLTMALVEAGSTVAVLDGGFVLASKAPRKRGPTGPRGPIARTHPRQAAVKVALLAAIDEVGFTTAKRLMDASNGAFKYTDVLLVARSLIGTGELVEVKKGRTATWMSATPVEDAVVSEG